MSDITTLPPDEFYNDEQQDLLKWLTVAFSILSMIGQIMIFLTYLCLKLESPISDKVEKDKARTIHVFIVAISFYDFCRIIGDLIDSDYPYSSSLAECRAQSVLITFGAMSTYFLIGLISIIMIISVYIQDKAEAIVDKIVSIRAIILTIITIIALCGALIPINYWCVEEYHFELKFIYFIPLLLIYLIIIISYLIISIYFCKQKSMEVNNNFYRDIKLFPFILLICWVFPVSRAIYNIVHDNEPSFWVAVIAVITSSIYGFCNFVAYWATLKSQYKKDAEQSDKSDAGDVTEIQAISQHDSD